MKQMEFVQTSEQDSAAESVRTRLCRLAADAVQMLAATELLLWALFAMLEDQFPEWKLPAGGFRTIQWFLVATIVLFGIAAPLTGRWRALVCVGLELGYIVLGVRYITSHMERLRGGLMAMYAQYLTEWNLYYQTNLFARGAVRVELGGALLFVVILLLVMFLLLYYVTAQRWPLLFLPLVVLIPGFLVDVLPGWRGLAILLAAVVVLYAGTDSPAKYRVLPARARDGEGAVRGRLGVTVFVAALAVSILAFSERAFGETAGRIPEKMQEFLAIQSELEWKLADLAERFIPEDRVYVDNSTPKYKGKRVLTITADGMPGSNLYLAEFYSGDYRNGRWKQSNRAYREAVREAGVNADRFGLLLWQMPYEESAKGAEKRLVDLFGTQNYRIDYQKSTDRAFVPYFSDVAGMDGAAWVEDEGLVRKRRATKSLEFVGPRGNIDVANCRTERDIQLDSSDGIVLSFGTVGVWYEPVSVSPYWYSEYVQERYVKKSGVAAVHEAAERLRSGLRRQEYRDSADARERNTYRVLAAKEVQRYLSRLAEYNLYLDRIPAGTDTIQYFLETGHEGYCMHFASAGALILQELGIPARYASGYIVKQRAFKEGGLNGSWSAQVHDHNAHAWVEIYLDGVGWVPVEMTPGYEETEDLLPTEKWNRPTLQTQHANKKPAETGSERESESETESESENESESGSESESETESEHEPESGDEDDSGQQGKPSGAGGSSDKGGTGGGGAGDMQGIRNRIWRIVLIVAGIFALLALICAAVCVGLRSYREALWREIRRKRHRSAIRRINRRIYRRLPKGIARHGMTDAEYEARLVRAYSDISPEAWRQYMRIVKKVAFSREAVSDEEMAHCLKCYRSR